MRSSLIAVVLLAAYCQARPSIGFDARPLFGSSYVIGGEDAAPGEFPWQLSQQRLGSSWSHSCGASLLSENYALSAAHCVDGASVTSIRIVAGVLDRTDPNGVVSLVSGYKTHEQWNVGSGSGSYPNDIAIITLTTPIYANGGNIQYAQLPADNVNQFVGETGVVSGWGRNGPGFTLPLILQKASINVISTDDCNADLRGSGSVTDSHICLLDIASVTGSCNGDSGGPFNIDNGSGQTVVAGITSWSIKNGSSVCQKSYPSIYTRVSAYLDWIKTNTP